MSEEPTPKRRKPRRKIIPLGKTGRLWLRVGRLTKAEEDELWRKLGSPPVGFTRPAPPKGGA